MPKLRKGAVIYVLERLDEDISPRDELDAENLAWVRAQQTEGNAWAWCMVKVTALVQHPYKAGETLSGVDYLGQCMYHSREDFITTSGYYNDMRDAALRALEEAWEDAWARRGK